MGYELTPVVNTGGVPMYIINHFLDKIKIPLFCETGTAGGASIIEASKHFDECYTVELIQGRANVDLSYKNIEWNEGHTVDFLKSKVDKFISYKIENKVEDYRYCLWWLDAHYSGDTPNTSEYKECYILEELEVISQYGEDSIILIDDARLFMGYPPAPNNGLDWAQIQDIFAIFKSKYNNYFVTIIDDYIIAMPDRLKGIFDDYWIASYPKRYLSPQERTRYFVSQSYNELLKYINL